MWLNANYFKQSPPYHNWLLMKSGNLMSIAWLRDWSTGWRVFLLDNLSSLGIFSAAPVVWECLPAALNGYDCLYRKGLIKSAQFHELPEAMGLFAFWILRNFPLGGNASSPFTTYHILISFTPRFYLGGNCCTILPFSLFSSSNILLWKHQIYRKVERDITENTSISAVMFGYHHF